MGVTLSLRADFLHEADTAQRGSIVLLRGEEGTFGALGCLLGVGEQVLHFLREFFSRAAHDTIHGSQLGNEIGEILHVGTHNDRAAEGDCLNGVLSAFGEQEALPDDHEVRECCPFSQLAGCVRYVTGGFRRGTRKRISLGAQDGSETGVG